MHTPRHMHIHIIHTSTHARKPKNTRASAVPYVWRGPLLQKEGVGGHSPGLPPPQGLGFTHPTPHPFLPPCLTQACEHGRRPLTALSPDLTRCRDAHWCRLREGCPLTGPCPYPGVILTLFTAWQETVGESHKRGWKILKWGETRAECSLGREA